VRSLFERVQDVDALVERRDVEDAMCHASVNANLSDARAHPRHGLPVVGFESPLYSSELKPCHPSGIRRERPEIVTRTPEPQQGLVGHGLIYKYLHDGAIVVDTRSPNPRLKLPAGTVVSTSELTCAVARRSLGAER
jgi:hypothetical protein